MSFISRVRDISFSTASTVSWKLFIFGTQGRNRTDKRNYPRWILSPVRLPFRHSGTLEISSPINNCCYPIRVFVYFTVVTFLMIITSHTPPKNYTISGKKFPWMNSKFTSYLHIAILARDTGFEPVFPGSEPSVLPLNESPVFYFWRRDWDSNPGMFYHLQFSKLLHCRSATSPCCLLSLCGGRWGNRTPETFRPSCFQDSFLAQPDTFRIKLSDPLFQTILPYHPDSQNRKMEHNRFDIRFQAIQKPYED